MYVRGQQPRGCSHQAGPNLPFCHVKEPKKPSLPSALHRVVTCIAALLVHAQGLGRGGCFPKMIPCTVLFVQPEQTTKNEERRDNARDGGILDIVIALPNLQGLVQEGAYRTGSHCCCRRPSRVRGGTGHWLQAKLDMDQGTESRNQTISFLRPAHVSGQALDLHLI